MRMPDVCGVIDRRILANFRVDAEVMRRQVPLPFRPQLVEGFALAGICLIRLRQIRPGWMPAAWGIGSENAAHRVAVAWDGDEGACQGVYIVRRDTNAWLNVLAGGTVFPGVHHHARFITSESADQLSVDMHSDDLAVRIGIAARVVRELPESSVFGSLDEASRFFQRGSLGYSVSRVAGRYDGLELACSNWQVEPLAVERIESSYFADTTRFPPGSVTFDSALLMREVRHRWHARATLSASSARV